MRRNPVIILLAIITVMWLLILVGSIIIFFFVVPLEISSLGRVFTGVLKAIISLLLALLWLFIFVKLRDWYASKLFTST